MARPPHEGNWPMVRRLSRPIYYEGRVLAFPVVLTVVYLRLAIYSYIHHTPLLSNLICLGATTIALTLKCCYLHVITSYVSRINAYITQLVTLRTYIRTSPTCNLRNIHTSPTCNLKNTYFECTCVTSYSIWLGSYSIQWRHQSHSLVL